MKEKEETVREQAKKRYDTWIQLHQKKAEQAAHVIWNWYSEFIDSLVFKQITHTLKKTGKNEVLISKKIVCSMPSKNSSHDDTRKQLLAIDCSGKLFVHNCVKYGKSYLLHDQDDLLEKVALPILMIIADTIRDETIWEIIDF